MYLVLIKIYFSLFYYYIMKMGVVIPITYLGMIYKI